MIFDETIQLQVLKLKSLVTDGIRGPILDQLLDESGESSRVRQMCAKVSVEMIEDLDAVVTLLDMSKREFIEAAVLQALIRAHEIIDASGVMSCIDERA